MKIENLEIKQVVKNYKELCNILNEKVKGGKSKQLQLKDFERYFKYHKEGNKFIIDQIYNKPKKKINNRNIEYIKIIEILILDKLANNKNKGRIFLSKNKLLTELKMINENYTYCKYSSRPYKLSKYLSINKTTIDEFYESTSSCLQRNLEKALNNLQSQFLITWRTQMTIGKINIKDTKNIVKEIHFDDYDEEVINYKIDPNITYLPHREATEEEEKYILEIERNEMLKLNCINKQDLIRNKQWDAFQKEVNNILLKEKNIIMYYKSYKILFNTKHIVDGYITFLKYLLKDTERNDNYRLLNTEITKRLLHNAINRHNNSIKNLKENNYDDRKIDTLERRSNNQYITDNRNLINKLVKKDSENIKDTIKKIKL